MRVASLFSGAGGMDLGFVLAGHRIVWANDNWEDAVSTYRKNLGDYIICCNIEKVKPSQIPEFDILIGGFPCQGFSVANMKRSAGDKRNFLYHQLVRILKATKPPFFVAENVKGLLSLEGGQVYEMITRDFERIGYRIETKVLNAADYGVPQNRERVFIFGNRRDIDPPRNFPPNPTHAPQATYFLLGLEKWVGVGEALKDLPEPGEFSTLANHECSKYKLRFNGYLGHRVVNPDLPAPTLTARGDDKGGVVVIHHPKNHRRISAREAAIIQSFPEDYIFEGTKTSVYRQIANAVPPLLALKVAGCIPASQGERIEDVGYLVPCLDP